MRSVAAYPDLTENYHILGLDITKTLSQNMSAEIVSVTKIKKFSKRKTLLMPNGERPIRSCADRRIERSFTNNRSETRENAFWVLLLRFLGEFDHICIC